MIQDWYFADKNSICSLRVAGVLIHNNNILVQRDKGGTEYALPGGHVAKGETSIESLVREFKEETGANITCNRLIWVEECFWNWGGKPTHTICLYYLVDIENEIDIPEKEFVPQKDNCNVLVGWMPLECVKDLTIYPTFLKEKVFDILPYTEHFISKQ